MPAGRASLSTSFLPFELQELEKTDLHDALHSELGYKGVYFKKPDYKKLDGCCIFFKGERYFLSLLFLPNLAL